MTSFNVKNLSRLRLYIIKGNSIFWNEYAIYEACIGVLGIQDICHFTSRDIGYFPFYFYGYGILCSISGILLFFVQDIRIQSRNTNNIKKSFQVSRHGKFISTSERV